MTQKKIEDVIALLGDLPTLPGIAIKILDLIKKEEASMEDIGQLLSKDPPLSAKVLKAANSPIYGVQGKISSVSQAVKLLGTNVLKNLALSFSVIESFSSGKNGLDYTRFWKKSLTAAVASKLIAQKVKPSFAEDAFFVGLLSDIGMLICNECIPDQYKLVLNEKKYKKSSLNDCEDQILGFNHMDLGAFILKEWGLPDTFSDAVQYHHLPKSSSENNESEPFIEISYLSSLYADFFNSPEKGISLGFLEHHAISYGLRETLQIDEIAEGIHSQTADIFPMFEIKPDKQENFKDIIEEAKIELVNLNNNLMESLLEQQKIISELKKQVMHDSLTNLLNYKSFQEYLEKELYRSKRFKRPISLLMADIDDFKKINDTEGHVAGDNMLFSIAGVMSESFRKSDIIARYGGEEFAIILPDTTSEGASKLAERLLKKVEALKVSNDGRFVSATLSIGISTLKGDEDIDRIDFVKRSDSALYDAKNQGKNRCCFYNE